MQDFEFRVYDIGHPEPSAMHVLTRDEDSARTLAERILRETEGGRHIDVWAARRYLFTVEAPGSLTGEPASRNRSVTQLFDALLYSRRRGPRTQAASISVAPARSWPRANG